MRSPRRRRQFVAGRRLLREALATWLGPDAPPWTLHAETDRAPVLLREGADLSPPRISISHSGDWIACALARVEWLGVDCEVAKARDWQTLGEAMLHPEEMNERRTLPATDQTAWHLTRWTAKEALLKACGAGLAGGMPAIRLGPDLALLAAPEVIPPPLVGWRIVHLVPAAGLHVALAWLELHFTRPRQADPNGGTIRPEQRNGPGDPSHDHARPA